MDGKSDAAMKKPAASNGASEGRRKNSLSPQAAGSSTHKRLKDHLPADLRSPVIAAYALTGFAHVASIAIFVGGTAGLFASGGTILLGR